MKMKSVTLIVLLAGIGLCLRALATHSETAWAPFLSASAARLLFRTLTIGMGLGAWFVSQSLIGARGLSEGPIGDPRLDGAAQWLADA
jgi:hypothetical protein